MENVSISLASSNVDMYESVLRRSREAMDCRDCEDVLQQGIVAFGCIQWAHRGLEKTADDERSIDWEDALRRVIMLHRAWLQLCPYSRQLIDEQKRKGFAPENVNEFLQCENEARRIVAERPGYEGEELPLGDTEKALREAAHAANVDLDKLLEDAAMHFGASLVLPSSSPLSDAELDELVADDDRALKP